MPPDSGKDMIQMKVAIQGFLWAEVDDSFTSKMLVFEQLDTLEIGWYGAIADINNGKLILRRA